MAFRTADTGASKNVSIQCQTQDWQRRPRNIAKVTTLSDGKRSRKINVSPLLRGSIDFIIFARLLYFFRGYTILFIVWDCGKLVAAKQET